MRTLYAIFATLFSMLFIHQSVSAATPAAERYKYSIELGDVGKIETVAATREDAFRAAANECFDRRVAMYEAVRGQLTEDRAMDLLDSCVNIAW